MSQKVALPTLLTGGFRTFDVGDPAHVVARELAGEPIAYLVLRQGEGWYVVEVDGDLIARLRAAPVGATLEQTLGLDKKDRTRALPGRSLSDSKRPPVHMRGDVEVHWRSHRGASSGPVQGRQPIVDDTGVVQGIADTAADANAAHLYPTLHTVGSARAINDEISEFCLTLDQAPTFGLTTPMRVQFADGEQTVDVHATVSSRHFMQPHGASWSHTFRVDRALHVSPREWCFQARAIGHRAGYSLTVTFHAGDQVVGAVTMTLRGSGSPSVSSDGLRVPTHKNDGLVVDISEIGDQFGIRMYEDGQLWGSEKAWSVDTESFFELLQRAASHDDLEELGYSLWLDLPGVVRKFLDRPEVEGKTVLIVSDGRVAPFEALQLRPHKGGPLLGVANPVTRWVRDHPMSTADCVRASKLAVIRPDYIESCALPKAKEEESHLTSIFDEPTLVRSSGDFKQLLKSTDTDIVHFAGHAEGSPPYLLVEDGKVELRSLHPSRPLLKAHPLFFLNGCRVGSGTGVRPSIDANFVKWLAASRCRAIVAPLIMVDDPAALDATRVFYGRLLGGDAVAGAVQEVRRMAYDEKRSSQHVGSYLSYLSFGAPSLGVRR